VSGIESRLSNARRRYQFPPTPDVASAVAAGLGERQPIVRRRLLLAVAVVLGGLAVLLGFSAGARSAIVDLLDLIPGVRLERVSTLPPAQLRQDVVFGRPSSLAEAQREAGFNLRWRSTLLGRPSRVVLEFDSSGDAVVTLEYGDRAVLTEWQTNRILFHKLLSPSTGIQSASVGQQRAVWLSGGDHAVFYLGRNGLEQRQAGVLVGNVLLWQLGRRGFRLELAGSREQAVRIAGSLRP
jgi:hypothetical protein